MTGGSDSNVPTAGQQQTKGSEGTSEETKAINELKAQRASTKGCITRIKTLITTKSETLTATELECRLEILESYWKLVISYQTSIEKLSPLDSSHNSTRSELEDLYCEAKSKILSLLGGHRRGSTFDGHLSVVSSNQPRVHLPPLKLPQFSGKYSEYPNFIATFNKLVHDDSERSTTEKYTHLRNCLSGAALRTIDALGKSTATYNEALTRLKERYDNTVLIFQEHISEMFDLPRVQKGSAQQLRSLVDDTSAHLSSLRTLGTDTDITNALIIHLVKSKLDSETQAKWDEVIDYSQLPTWDAFEKVLSRRCQFLEARDQPPQVVNSKPQIVNSRFSRSRSNPSLSTKSATSLTTMKARCPYCSETGHTIMQCEKFGDLPVLERFEQAKRLSLCINCLSKGHSVTRCSSSKCRICSRPHHTLLHRHSIQYPNSSSSEQPSQPGTSAVTLHTLQNSPTSSLSSSLSSTSEGTDETVLLSTAIILVQDKSGCYHPARALLDNGSQSNFITKDLAKKLRLKIQNINMHIDGIQNCHTAVQQETCSKIKSRLNQFERVLTMRILSSITRSQPDEEIRYNCWKIPKNIPLADPAFYKPQKIDVLIGAGLFLELLSVGQIKLSDNLPILQKTVFGWIVGGGYKSRMENDLMCNVVSEHHSPMLEEDSALHNIVNNFWQLETIESTKPRFNDEQQSCETLFLDTIRQLPCGRLMVKLPFKESTEVLGDSIANAKRRLLSLERKLARSPELKAQYSEFLQDYLTRGHMELADEKDIPQLHYYMPHHCVLRPDSSTTSLRVVFDASSRTSSQIALNDILSVGPTVQNDLQSILLQFRWYAIALTADVSKMYRQILVYPEDRHFQYIVWRENPTEDLKSFRLKTITYGTASAPYLATRCLNYLADLNAKQFPLAAKVIKENFYVDDMLVGADTLEDVLQIQREVQLVLQSAKMELRKWCSNSAHVLHQIPESDREKPLKVDNCDIIKTLGLVWDPNDDKFRITHKLTTRRTKITKRSILSDVARVFDPLGLVNPVVVRAKVFLQEIWLLKLNWDESIPTELHTRWINFLDNLSQLNNLRIPRYVRSSSNNSMIELHGFADASLRAYGACIYVRCLNEDGQVSVHLLCAKSKVAPTKPIRTLPCLELCGCELLANLLAKVRSSIQTNFNSIFLWTDSQVVLGWLAAHPSTWQTFVANRVSRIQELTDDATWRYVNTKSNPADILSRGASPAELKASSWFTGPEYLQNSPEKWPTMLRALNPLPEKRKAIKVMTCVVQSSFLDIVYKTSSFPRNRRIFAYVKRFINNLKAKRTGQHIVIGTLTAAELDSALLSLIWTLQQAEFQGEIEALQNKNPISPKSCLQSLNPFLDDNSHLLCVGGRLQNADIPFQTKSPILLPKRNPFVKSYINYLHFKHFHAGSQTLIAILRRRFWIINARDYTRRILKECVHCFRYRPKLLNQMMGHLPTSRVSPSMAFSTSGVDFCGPIMTTYKIRGKRPYKSYIAVFVCFVSKGVHLEVVSELSTEAFLAALKRFVSRRTLCKHLYCDNATNFVGSRRKLVELREAFLQQQTQQRIAEWCAEESIQFHHIPPRAPHFGGLWEAAVKTAKGHLLRTFKDSLLTFEELSTVCCQIEAIMNSRPITQLSSDPNDEQALTPAHFWSQAPLATFVEPDLTTSKFTHLRRWQRISQLQQHFWRRWSAEYLSGLHHRYKWKTQSPNALINMVVLIHDDNLPPLKWLLGRIIQVIPGKDNQVRVVDFKTKAGIFRRPVHKIAPLPIESED